MSSVINTNVTAIRSQTIYNKNNDYMTVAMNRVATGMKVNSAKDNASVWGITEKMKERIRANDQANQNIQNDTALLRTAQDGFGNTLDILKTIKERAINAANDSNVSTDRSKISEEVKQLVAQIDDNAAKVKFNGRQLLNGGVESGGNVTEASTTNATAASAVANAVTATNPQGTNSIYSVTGFKVWDNTEKKFTDISSTATTLNNIYDANGKALFADGDKITLSFDDNGESKSYTYTVSQASSVAIGDVFNSFASSAATSIGTIGLFSSNATMVSGVADAYGADVKATDAGYYFIGASNEHKITNFGITIEAGDPKTGSEDRIKAAQEVLNPNAVMQTYGKTTDGTTMFGSNIVYHLESQKNTNLGAVTGELGNKTQWMDLKWENSSATDGTNYLYDSHNSTTTNEDTTFTISVDGKTATWKGSSTIEDINEELAKKGINLRMQIVTEETENLYYDDKAVTKGDADSEVAVKASEFSTATNTTKKTGLYFIGANGEAVNSIKITGGTTSGAASATVGDIFDIFTAESATKKTGFYNAMKLSSSFLNSNSTTTSSTSKDATSTSSLLPQGEALQFFVGGEQNFGVNFSIGKANNQTLFGMSGDDFAKKFETKEDAEEAIGIIDNAINKVLTEQTRLGAMEARLGYTSDNIVSMNDNLNAGISAFRDTDMAKEMTEYMKYSVLSQASQYMLSQASQNAFSVLNLLQS